MKKITICMIVCAVMALNAHAQNGDVKKDSIPQKEVINQIEEVTVINYGDGRLLFREYKEPNLPLQGKHRIINGYESKCIIAEFKDGMYHGEYQLLVRNNLSEEGTYKDGWKHGLFKEYNSDGKRVKRETPYCEGKINGIRKTYYLNGAIETEKGYKMSEEDGIDIENDWETKQPAHVMNYKDGFLDGEQMQQIFSNANNFKKTCTYRNCKLDGEYLEIYTSGKGEGKIRRKGMYKNGEKVGKWEDNTEKYDFKK